MRQIGIIIPALYSQQLVYETCIGIQKAISNQLDCTIFFEDYAPLMIRPACGLMHVSELYSFNGILISTNLNNTKLALNIPLPSKKIFYIWELEWLKNSKDFIDNNSVYQNPQLELYTRSKSYANAIKNYSNMTAQIDTLENIICMNHCTQH